TARARQGEGDDGGQQRGGGAPYAWYAWSFANAHGGSPGRVGARDGPTVWAARTCHVPFVSNVPLASNITCPETSVRRRARWCVGRAGVRGAARGGQRLTIRTRAVPGSRRQAVDEGEQHEDHDAEERGEDDRRVEVLR